MQIIQDPSTYWTQGQINPPNPRFTLYVGDYTKTVENPRIILYTASLKWISGAKNLPKKLMRPVYGVGPFGNRRLKEQEGYWYVFPGTYTAGEQTGYEGMDETVPKWGLVPIATVELYGDLRRTGDGYITAESNDTAGPGQWWGQTFGNCVFAAEPIQPPWPEPPPA